MYANAQLETKGPRVANHESSVLNRCQLPGAPKTLCVSGNLPETVNRVETHPTHRKQTMAHASTRDVPAHNFSCNSGWQVGVTRRKCSCAARLAVCYSEGVPPSGKRASAPALPSQQWRPSPAHFILSRCLLAPAPLAGAFSAPLTGAAGESHRDATGRPAACIPKLRESVSGDGSHTDWRARVTDTGRHRARSDAN